MTQPFSCHPDLKLSNESELTDIFKYPARHLKLNKKELTIGDLHANALLLIYYLTLYSVWSLESPEYTRLVNIYIKRELTKEDKDSFDKIIDSLNIESPELLLRFLGDDLCDRGQNDYFILKIFNKLHHANISFEILLSNHTFDFFHALETGETYFVNKSHFINSFISLYKLLKLGVINDEDIKQLLKVYSKHLKLLSYTHLKDGITIYSHAVIDFSIITSLARRFGVSNSALKTQQLSTTIDQINDFFTLFIRNNPISALLNFDDDSDELVETPFATMLSNRRADILNRTASLPNFKIVFVHGHDSSAFDENAISLDGLLGKGLSNYQGRLKVLQTNKLLPESNVTHPLVNFFTLFGKSFSKTDSEDETQSYSDEEEFGLSEAENALESDSRKRVNSETTPSNEEVESVIPCVSKKFRNI